ncbi:MAG: ABC transporter ATP-binding protein [Rhodomicrobium sp.]
MTPLLSVEKLNAFYGTVQALHNVSFSMAKGGVAALLGANGAGKTTTLRAISGMIRRSGSIRFKGTAIDKSSTEHIARLGVAHVPEGRGTFARLTVEENLRVGGISRPGRRSTVDGMELCFGYFPILKRRLNQQAGTLSGGEQQMLAVSRALMLRPSLMLLDEPSFGLAPLIVQELFEILRTINRQEKAGLLIVEQNASLALGIADKTYLLETGRIVLEGSPAELTANEGVRQAYLGY